MHDTMSAPDIDSEKAAEVPASPMSQQQQQPCQLAALQRDLELWATSQLQDTTQAPNILSGKPAEVPTSSTSQQPHPRKLTTLERNNSEWESHKNEIRNLYIDQGKNLKETMQWFEHKRGFTWSERNWKIKLKEWKFEKNVPAKEMNFMAAKARKRELEERKDTMFYRNGILVDGSKVEQFKKQKLSVATIDTKPMPATPQHISYETPKPDSSCNIPTASSEDGSEVQKADRQNLLAAVDENPSSEGGNSFARVFRPNFEQSRSKAGILEGNRLLDFSRSRDGTANYDVQKSLDHIGVVDFSDHNTHSASQRSLQHFLIQTEGVETLDDDCLPSMLLDGLRLVPLKEEVRIARQSMEHGQRSTAQRQYCDIIRKYVKAGWKQNNSFAATVITELIESFDPCTKNEIPALASLLLDLLKSLMSAVMPDSTIYTLCSSALDKLLRANLGISESITWNRVISFYDDPDRELCCLRVLTFVCHLTEFLKGSSLCESNVSLRGLREAILPNWETRDKYKKEPGTIFCRIDNLLAALESVQGPGDHTMRECYSLIEPSITKLASAYSATGLSYEAEALFAALRSQESLEDLGRTRTTRISVRYCRHLERHKRYEELLSVLHDTFANFESFYLAVRNFISAQSFDQVATREDHEGFFDMRDMMDKIPGPLKQYVSSKKAREITRLYKFLTPTRGAYRYSDSHESEDDDITKVVVIEEEDTSQSEEEDREMVDNESANKFGVTYTESLMTGISFNYSDLYR
ncbi:hypothetical protein L207DRAFT_642457 [Hyaloscypha variabilis F]|uniref:Clr5 domain-containing protein n=1 Tax=Hyaloscypha variabilis (strain UAMH 11265 / GT02V1 / F) TaxID=1149755 RepID=A0A2J6QSP7_HYAVF|nr:hypothetical protein L207DRAFT_642457 [Hyaloscypha variabilis F]